MLTAPGEGRCFEFVYIKFDAKFLCTLFFWIGEKVDNICSFVIKILPAWSIFARPIFFAKWPHDLDRMDCFPRGRYRRHSGDGRRYRGNAEIFW